jgi:hypothetical protein
MPILYMSSYIIKHKNQYYEGLDQVRTQNNWNGWIMFMLDAVEQTSMDTIRTIGEIRILLDQAIETVKSELPKIYTKELVESLFSQPYCRISTLEENLGITRFTASKYLKELERIELLKGEKVGRDMIYINKPLFDLLKKDTLDEKLALIERELDAVDIGDTIQFELGEKTFFKIFDSWLSSLMRKLIPVGQYFNKYFLETKHYAFVISGIGAVEFNDKDPEEVIRLLRADCLKNKNKIGDNAVFEFSFFYNKLKKGGLNTIPIRYTLNIELKEIYYTVFMDEFSNGNKQGSVPQFEKRLLHKPITKFEIEGLVKKMKEALIDEIDYFTKKHGIR